jgi:hypothetical protein
MMPVILAAANFLVLVMIIVSAVLGWGEPAEDRMFLHMYWGVTTSLLGLLAHTFTMFFFIGTSKAIRLTCEKHQVAYPFIEQSNTFKRVIAGRTMIANTVLIIQPVLGAAVYSGRLASEFHYLAFWLTLGVQAWVLYVELKLLGLNNVLMAKVGEWKAAGGMSAVSPDDPLSS